MRAILLLLCVSFAATCAQAAAPDLRTRPAADGSSVPIFIAASDVTTEDGRFDTTVAEPWRTMIEQYGHAGASEASADEDPCSAGMWSEEDMERAAGSSGPAPSRSAKAVFRGTISAVIPGFFYGSPGSLLELTGISFLKGGSELPNMHQRAWVRHPYARFSIGSLRFCSSAARDAYVPKAGDGVLVYVFDSPLDRDSTFLYTSSRVLAIESAQSGFHVPEELRQELDGVRTIDAAGEKLRKSLATPARQSE
jgi:hypothetical protein